ncbi:MAG: hypothetical protein H6622_02690 [Halobacteriovoraceae bacterium]|nr:hypothetical protein [Halobacteriovoraceae bacterium]
MEITLAKKSGILLIKSKFFLYRALTYFSFLLIPVWLQKATSLSMVAQCVLMLLYIAFMIGQWFLFGKELDHRLKIYYRVNSSIDRVVYRITTGMIFFILFFNVVNFLPPKWVNNIFWSTWVFLGLFYSWPTRGKIIQESVSSNFNEYRYLDSFEKTLLTLIALVFAISTPLMSTLNSIGALKLFYDHSQALSNVYWNFMTVNYYPFFKYSELMRLAWGLHFYVVGGGLFFITLYAFFRFFVSRRLAILGVFATISSWSFSKVLSFDLSHLLTMSHSLLMIWTVLWVVKSSSYRTGLFLGIVFLYGVILNIEVSLYVPALFLIIYNILLSEKTQWFKKRVLKYSSFGLASIVGYVLLSYDNISLKDAAGLDFVNIYLDVLGRKAFFYLHLIGVPLTFLKIFNSDLFYLRRLNIRVDRLKEMLIVTTVLILSSLMFDYRIFGRLSLMWYLALFSLVPLELIFQAISRLRSRRNMIYLVYILICLLDSHLEGRIKILFKLLS